MGALARRLLLPLLLVLGGAAASASDPPSGDSGALPAVSAPPDVQAEIQREGERARQSFGVARARLSYPQLASAGFGVLVADRSREIDCVTQCELTGWLASAEAGVGGAQFDFGPAYLIAELGDNRFFLSRRYMGYAVRASVMRTWGETPRRKDNEWLGGLEGEFTIVSLNLTLGVYRRIDGRDAGEPWLISGGIGWGF